MRQIKHSQLFLDSLIHPKKLAAYRILSIGKVIQYTFLLVFILTTFSFGQFVNDGANIVLTDEIKDYVLTKAYLCTKCNALYLTDNYVKELNNTYGNSILKRVTCDKQGRITLGNITDSTELKCIGAREYLILEPQKSKN